MVFHESRWMDMEEFQGQTPNLQQASEKLDKERNRSKVDEHHDPKSE